MKLCVAQTRPVPGDVEANLAHHLVLVARAVAQGVELLAFPELSLTGYEPTLPLEISPDDPRLAPFQSLSDECGITLGVGLPTPGRHISTVWFRPRQPRLVYSKQYLHADEEPFFRPGLPSPLLGKVAPALCYELSIPAHAADAHARGARVYLASVAKTAAGVEAAHARLAEIARDYSMTVLMANCVGLCDGVVCAGRSAIWNPDGERVAQLGVEEEGLLTGQVVV